VFLPAPGPDGKIYLTAARAGEAFGVKPDTIRRWERIGYLAAVPGSREAGGALYEFTAIGRAEKRARDAAIATSGTDRRVRRHIAA